MANVEMVIKIHQRKSKSTQSTKPEHEKYEILSPLLRLSTASAICGPRTQLSNFITLDDGQRP